MESGISKGVHLRRFNALSPFGKAICIATISAIVGVLSGFSFYYVVASPAEEEEAKQK